MNDISKMWNRVSASTGVPLGGISFVYDVFDHMRQGEVGQPADVVDSAPSTPRRTHCTAADYCGAFVRVAQEKFGADHAKVLYSWNLETSEKLGRLFYALIDRNLMGKQDSDFQKEFDGQFDLSNAVGKPRPAQPFRYSGDTLKVIYVQPTWRQKCIEWFLAVVLICFAFAVTVALSVFIHPIHAGMVAYFLVIGLILLRFSAGHPYRFSLRALLATMTLVALVLGIVAYLTR